MRRGPKVGPVLHNWVKPHVQHAQVGGCHRPQVATPKDGVGEEVGEVADGRVLDGGDLLPDVVHVPKNRNTLPSREALSTHSLSDAKVSLDGETKAITERLKKNIAANPAHGETHSAVPAMGLESVLEAREELPSRDVEGVAETASPVLFTMC